MIDTDAHMQPTKIAFTPCPTETLPYKKIRQGMTGVCCYAVQEDVYATKKKKKKGLVT